MIEIDGSYGSGGGQVLRTAMGLACLTGKACRISNIRAKRRKPGLAPQHLTAIKAVAEICGAELSSAFIGSTNIIFKPGSIRGGKYSFDIGTAGSVTLVLQALVPPALFADNEVEIEITGGTDVPWSPTTAYFEHIFCDHMKKMGAEIAIETDRHGFYPRGGGKAKATIKPWKNPSPLVMESRSDVQKLEICSIASHSLKKAHVAERQADAAESLLRIKPVVKESLYVDSESPGSSINIRARYPECILGSQAIGERGVPSERVGETAATELLGGISSGATADIHAADQLLIYMALARGKSSITVRELTGHIRTGIWLIEQFIDKKFTVSMQGNAYKIEI